MQIQLKEPNIWLASEPVDFRKSINGLSAIVVDQFQQKIGDSIFIFYNGSRKKVKLLCCHRNGMMLIYKSFDRKKLFLKRDAGGLCSLDELQLSWLLAGLDWIEMSNIGGVSFDDFF